MTATKYKRPPAPIKWHGGKHYLAGAIVALMPPRCKNPNAPAPDDPGWLHYVEAYAGGLSVLFANDPEGISEVVNDKNQELSHFWNVLADPTLFDDFKRRVEATPFSQALWEFCTTSPRHGIGRIPLESAVEFFVRCRQSMSGRMKDFAPLTRNRTRRGMNEQASAWLSAIDGLPEVHARLKRVMVLCDDALNVILAQDGKRTLFYLDPPYLHETRATTGEYDHEMTDQEHAALLELLGSIEGRFILSGYDNPLYAEAAKRFGWNRRVFDLPNNAAGGKTKRRMQEVLWWNY